MSSLTEETPPPPPLSEAPPSYVSRDSLIDVSDSVPQSHAPHTLTPHTLTPHTPHNLTQVHCHNPRFEQQDDVSLHLPPENEGPVSARSDLPPPYSPGLAAFFSTRLPEHNVNDPPPSYYSLFGQIREAREQSDNNITFLRRVGQIILNTVGCTILLLVFMSVPIAILVIGSLFVHNCSLEPLIPVYLIVGGISGILKNVLLIIENIMKRYSDQLSSQMEHTKCIVYVWRAFNLLFNLFMLAWTIAGGYWVYHIYTEVTATQYDQCAELLYKFGFGIVTSSYILLVLTCACVCCCAGICLKVNSRGRRAGSSLSGSSTGSLAGNSGQDDQSDGEITPEEQEIASSIENYPADTLTSNLNHHYGDNDDNYLRRFRYLDSAHPLSTAGLERSILQYDSSPYPTRHTTIGYPSSVTPTLQSATPTSHSSSPHNSIPMQAMSGSSTSIPTRPLPPIRGEGLYITLSSDGISVTEV